MKRIAAIGAVVAAFGIAPSLAAGGNFAAEMKPQLSAQVVRRWRTRGGRRPRCRSSRMWCSSSSPGTSQRPGR